MRLMELRRIAGIAVVVGILGWVLPPAAWAQTPPPEVAEADEWGLTPGRIELGAMVGGGFSLAGTTREATEFAFLPRLGYVFAEQEHFLPGSFEVVTELAYLTVFQHQTVHVGGIAALLKYNVRTGSRWTPYLVGGAGVSFASHRVPHHGTSFNFTPEGGLGLQYAITPRSLLGAEWRLQHLSNAGTSSWDAGLNMSLFLLGFSVVY